MESEERVHKQAPRKKETERNGIESFLKLLRELQKIDSEFPLQYAICLAEISMDEGLSLTDLSERTEMPLSTVSRIIGALSKFRQRGEPYGLVDARISMRERRRKELYLTTKGQNVVNAINRIIH